MRKFSCLRASLPRVTMYALAIIITAVTACTPDGNLIIGPIRVTATIGEASFLQTLFSLKGNATVTHRQKFCDMPTEQELSDQVTTVGDIDLSRFVRLNRLELVKAVITATSGDFDFMTKMTVRFIPKPGAGPAVDLGTASDPNGLGTKIELVPPGDVDFLALIRANDAGDPNACPKIEYEITFKSVPLQDVEYRLDVTVDGYAEVGREKAFTAVSQ